MGMKPARPRLPDARGAPTATRSRWRRRSPGASSSASTSTRLRSRRPGAGGGAGRGVVSFLEADLASLDPGELGSFDYVVAHGVLRVPEPVREALPGSAAPSSSGTACVHQLQRSARRPPEGHDLGAMRFTRATSSVPTNALDAAREMLSVLAGDPGRRSLPALLRCLRRASARPKRRRDLPRRPRTREQATAVHGLRRRGGRPPAAIPRGGGLVRDEPSGPPRAAADLLARCGEDRIAREQYLDFLKCRAYRQTLVCREELRLPEAPSPDAARELLAAAPVRPTSPRAEPSVAPRSSSARPRARP